MYCGCKDCKTLENQENAAKANKAKFEEFQAKGGIDLGQNYEPIEAIQGTYEPEGMLFMKDNAAHAFDFGVPEAEDLINKPNHYHKGGFDIYEIMQAKMTPEEYRGFCKGNVLKYLLREDQKGGVNDIKKLRFNADRLIENMEGKKYIPEHKREGSK